MLIVKLVPNHPVKIGELKLNVVLILLIYNNLIKIGTLTVEKLNKTTILISVFSIIGFAFPLA